MSAVLLREAQAKFPYNTVNGYDSKAWAKRIIYRHERNDKSLLPIQIPFAYAAMGKSVP